MNTPFTQLTDKLAYPPNLRSSLAVDHAAVIDYVTSSYRGSFKERRQVVSIMNTLSYLYLNGDSIPETWSRSNPLSGLDIVDEDLCKSKLGKLYLDERKINWDIEPVIQVVRDESDDTVIYTRSKPEITPDDVAQYERELLHAPKYVSDPIVPTPKEDLYIQSPKVPRFDYSNPVVSGYIDDTLYVVYSSLPSIPTRQVDISSTTDASKLSMSDIRKLFPNRFIPTRASSMYMRYENMDYHSRLGVVFPVSGFTTNQVLDNIVKYPHLFRLSKYLDDGVGSFYTTIEVDGSLYKVSDIWRDLPESSVIPYTSDFVKEYVVRRYLLERDIKHIDHKYKMYGSLDPFLTLFTTIDEYIELGYTDIDYIGRKCVESRVSYKKSRNPVFRRLNNV